jgi:hypothetical protein
VKSSSMATGAIDFVARIYQFVRILFRKLDNFKSFSSAKFTGSCVEGLDTVNRVPLPYNFATDFYMGVDVFFGQPRRY